MTNQELLELAVKLQLDISWTRDARDRVIVQVNSADRGSYRFGSYKKNCDPYKETRRSIVMVAPIIGRNMK